MKLKSDFLNEINSRGFIYQSSDINALDSLMSKKKITAYIGFDITSDSLHIGSLVQLMLLNWLEHYGHNSIALVGGGTTLVGDPSGKDTSRKILSKHDIDKNISSISETFEKFINLKKKARVINNYEWLSDINYINFLRDFGSKLTINKMLTFDSVKNRLEREQPLTFLEFNYMLLQSYDFYYLNKNYNCILQLGGSDQWGNIINGIDLIKKATKNQAFALTSPLITNADGSKMGKTAQGAIWIDKKKFSNFDFFQFWRNIDDKKVVSFLKLFTKIPLKEINKLSKLKGEEINAAKEILAYEATKICRGEENANEAAEISKNLFKSKKIDERINSCSIKKEKVLNTSLTIIDAIEMLGLVNSRSEIKRLIKSKGVKVNDMEYLIKEKFSLSSYINSNNNELKISVGKKKFGIVKII